MDKYKISEDIYKDSLLNSEDSYIISNEILEDLSYLDIDEIKQKIYESYNISGRYWIWKIGVYTFRNFWNSMFDNGEMRLDAPGIKYIKSYSTLAALEEAYVNIHPDRKGITIVPAACYAFANNIRKGDVIIVYNSTTGIIGWGIIEGDYMYRPTRTFGCHFRKVIWNKIQMPFIFMNRKPLLYLLTKEETHYLKETLIDKIHDKELPLPFDFIKKKG